MKFFAFQSHCFSVDRNLQLTLKLENKTKLNAGLVLRHLKG